MDNRSFKKKVFAAGLAASTVLWSLSALFVAVPAAAVSDEAHPDGTLVLSGGTVWRVDDGQRWGFDTPERFFSNRFDFADVVPANSFDLALPDGGLHPMGSGVLFNDNGTVYQLSGGMKHGFTTAAVFTGLGFDFANVIPGDLSAVPAGAVIDNTSGAHMEGSLVNDNGTVWYITATGRMGFTQPGELFSTGAGFEDIVPANAADLALANEGNMGFRDGTLVNDGGTVWAVANGERRGFPTASCFTDFGFNFNMLLAGDTSSLTTGGNYCPGGGTTTPPPVDSTGTLTVSLASDTPATEVVPSSAQRVPFTKVNLTATGGNVVIDSWTVERSGVAQDSSFSGVEIIDLRNNATISDNAKNLSSIHQANFSEDLTINNGETVMVMVAGNIAASPGAGERPRLALNAVNVKGNANVVGSFPVVGNAMELNTSITIGTAPIQRGAFTNATNTTLEVGQQDYAMLSFQIQAGSQEDLVFNQVKVYQQGSASLTDDLENIVLLKDSTVIAEGEVADSNTVNFDFADILIPEGQTQQYQVQADVIDGSGRTVDFGVWRAADFNLVGQTYGFSILPTISGTGSSSANPVLSDNQHTISTGTLRVTRSNTVPAENIAVGSNQVLGAFDFDVKGEPIEITAFTLTVASSTSGTIVEDALRSVRLVDPNGVTVAGPTDVTNNALTVAWTDSFTVPTGVNAYQVVGTLFTSGGWSSDDTITVSIQTPASAITARGDVTNQSVTASPSSNVSASQQTVKASTLTVTKNSTPTNKTVVVGDTDVLAGSWTFDASNSGEDVRVTSVAVRASTTGQFEPLEFFVRGETTPRDTNDNPVTSNNANTTSTFSFSNPIVVPKGDSVVVDLILDVPSSGPNAGEVDSYGITSSGALSAFGVQTGNTATATVVANDGALLTVAAAGTLTINLDASAPAIRQVVHGTTGVSLTEVNLKANNEAVDITQLIVRVADSSLTGTATGDFNQVDKFFLKLDGQLIGNLAGYNIDQATRTVNLSRGDLTVPEGDSNDVVLSVLGDIVDFGTNLPGSENEAIAVGLNGSNAFTAFGNGSNAAPTVTYTDSTGSDIILHRSVPSVVTETISGNTLASGNPLHRAKISAIGDTVGIYRLSYNVTTTTGLDVDNAFVRLVSCGGCGGVSNGAQLTATDNGDYFADGTYTYDLIIDPTQSHGKRYLAIAAGQTATVDLVANSITGFQTGTDSATTQFLGDAATTTNDTAGDPAAAFTAHDRGNFVWSPLHNDESQAATALTSKQWYNGYYVDGLGATATTTSAQTYSDN